MIPTVSMTTLLILKQCKFAGNHMLYIMLYSAIEIMQTVIIIWFLISKTYFALNKKYPGGGKEKANELML